MASEQVLICYHGACTDAAHPCGYNRVTHGLYCLGCAREINKISIEDNAYGGPFYPLFPLVGINIDGGSLAPGLILIRPQPETST